MMLKNGLSYSGSTRGSGLRSLGSIPSSPNDMARQENFYGLVYDIVKKIPRGRVATYGYVAMMVSTPRAAQAVGWALRALPDGHDVPWQRVINSRGMISIENLRAPKSLQVKLLRAEGVEVRQKEGNYFVDIEKYLWRP